MIVSRSDRLRIGPEISRDASGTVYSGPLGGKPVAVKKIHQLLMDYAIESKEALEAASDGFRRGCELLQAAKHANAVAFQGALNLWLNQDDSILLVLFLWSIRCRR